MKNLFFLLLLLTTLGAGCVSDSPVPLDAKDDAQPIETGRTIDLSNQGLTAFPQYILDKTSLEVLDISNNGLSGSLPAEIHDLKKLRVLDASNNDFTGIPAEIGQLEQLETLDFSNNQLTGIPHELGNLQHLKTLNLQGNDISEFDLRAIRQGLPSDTEILL